MFKNLSVGAKLGAGFGVVLVLTAAIAAVGYMGFEGIAERKVKSDNVKSLAVMTLQARVAEKNFQVRGEKKYADQVAAKVEQIKTVAQQSREIFADDYNKKEMDNVLGAAARYLNGFNGYVNGQQDGEKALAGMEEYARSLIAVANQVREQQKAEVAALISEGASADRIEDQVGKADDANRLIKWALEVRRYEKNFQLREDSAAVDSVKTTLAKMGDLTRELKARYKVAEHKKAADQVLGSLQNYAQAFDHYVQVRNDQKQAMAEMLEGARAVLDQAESTGKDQEAKLEQQVQQANTMMLVGALIAVVLGVFAAFVVTRSIVRPLARALDVTNRIADGDLTADVTAESRDEVGRLVTAIGNMADNLRGIVGNVLNAGGSITNASREIAEGNQNLSERTEEQASSLEETASSMEEMTSTVRQNADNAAEANQLATGVRELAEQGGQVVGNAVTAMGEINQASKKIADIISVIDEIAFQTNLLALNAAVEAARAGEQGRGFAVVAGEVRKLAQRSAESAREIKDLIEDSVGKVQQGSALVEKSGKSLDEIVQGVKKVSDIVAEIAAASQEQSAGIDQVNKAVMQMDEMTQQNAALVEQAAAASRAMEQQAQDLQEMMGVFKVDAGDLAVARKVATGASRPAIKPSAPAPVAHPKPKAAPLATRPAARPAPKSTPSGDDEEWEEF